MKTKNYLKILMAVLIWLPVITMAQGVAINDDNSEADPSAMLDVKSDNMGFLLPRVSDTSAINSPAEGLMIYDLSEHCIKYYNGSEWSDCIWQSWKCGDPITDNRDNQVYRTVKIGDQCWMAENLNIGSMTTSYTQSDNELIEKHCYSNQVANCDTYGGLYQWNELMNWNTAAGSTGICPDDWHIPTIDEWNTLVGYLGGDNVAGGQLKQTSIWNSPNTGATNSSGFSALPGGNSYRAYDGSGWVGYYYLAFSDIVNIARFFTSSGVTNHSYIQLQYNSANLYTYSSSNPYQGFSVRCVKD